jgi:RNA polymerase sigma-70 factor (ECF subfamily)
MERTEFEELYRTTASSLRRYALRSCGNRQQAEDIVQEAFLRILTPTAQPIREPVRYLYRLTTNLLRDEWRRAPRRTEEELSDDHPAPSSTQQADLGADLAAALARLGPKDRQLLWLAYAEGFTHHEIAEIMGRRPASIRVLLFRARQRLERVITRGGSS